MKLPDYVSKKEVQRVCKELGFRDWSTLTQVSVMQNEASEILRIVNVKGMNIPIDDFKQGLEVELEHGVMYDDANVTNNHPILLSLHTLRKLWTITSVSRLPKSKEICSKLYCQRIKRRLSPNTGNLLKPSLY